MTPELYDDRPLFDVSLEALLKETSDDNLRVLREEARAGRVLRGSFVADSFPGCGCPVMLATCGRPAIPDGGMGDVGNISGFWFRWDEATDDIAVMDDEQFHVLPVQVPADHPANRKLLAAVELEMLDRMIRATTEGNLDRLVRAIREFVYDVTGGVPNGRS